MQEIKFKTYADSSMESDIHKKILQEKFWVCIRDLNLDFKRLMKNKNILLEDVARLNNELFRLNSEYQMTMIDMVSLILDKEYIPVRQFTSILDAENMKILKGELSSLFRLKTSATIDIDYLVK